MFNGSLFFAIALLSEEMLTETIALKIFSGKSLRNHGLS